MCGWVAATKRISSQIRDLVLTHAQAYTACRWHAWNAMLLHQPVTQVPYCISAHAARSPIPTRTGDGTPDRCTRLPVLAPAAAAALDAWSAGVQLPEMVTLQLPNGPNPNTALLLERSTPAAQQAVQGTRQHARFVMMNVSNGINSSHGVFQSHYCICMLMAWIQQRTSPA